jgi:hypothetical protein
MLFKGKQVRVEKGCMIWWDENAQAIVIVTKLHEPLYWQTMANTDNKRRFSHINKITFPELVEILAQISGLEKELVSTTPYLVYRFV